MNTFAKTIMMTLVFQSASYATESPFVINLGSSKKETKTTNSTRTRFSDLKSTGYSTDHLRKRDLRNDAIRPAGDFLNKLTLRSVEDAQQISEDFIDAQSSITYNGYIKYEKEDTVEKDERCSIEIKIYEVKSGDKSKTFYRDVYLSFGAHLEWNLNLFYVPDASPTYLNSPVGGIFSGRKSDSIDPDSVFVSSDHLELSSSNGKHRIEVILNAVGTPKAISVPSRHKGGSKKHCFFDELS